MATKYVLGQGLAHGSACAAFFSHVLARLTLPLPVFLLSFSLLFLIFFIL